MVDIGMQYVSVVVSGSSAVKYVDEGDSRTAAHHPLMAIQLLRVCN